MSHDSVPNAVGPGIPAADAPRDYAYTYAPQYAPQYADYRYPAAQVPANYSPYTSGWLNFRDGTYLKGFVVGAAVAVVATNPYVQKKIVAGAVKLWSAVQGGVEEVKEQIKDIKAEVSRKD
ncbi:MAG: YtxH domain-containing protein [Desulfovibrionaceae bacterium]|jgi:hypothetical protein|nr:YtxH domain-containing protein [Desulfovibrionaceae bacterium]